MDLYFVLNGLVNGEVGVRPVPAGGGRDTVQADGWYWIPVGATDGLGPHPSKEAAREAARREIRYYLMDEDGWESVPESYSGIQAAERGMTVVRAVWAGGCWELSLQGSYDVLTLRVTVQEPDDAVRIYHGAFLVADEFQG